VVLVLPSLAEEADEPARRERRDCPEIRRGSFGFLSRGPGRAFGPFASLLSRWTNISPQEKWLQGRS
jgi:hypothetical protein